MNITSTLVKKYSDDPSVLSKIQKHYTVNAKSAIRLQKKAKGKDYSKPVHHIIRVDEIISRRKTASITVTVAADIEKVKATVDRHLKMDEEDIRQQHEDWSDEQIKIAVEKRSKELEEYYTQEAMEDGYIAARSLGIDDESLEFSYDKTPKDLFKLFVKDSYGNVIKDVNQIEDRDWEVVVSNVDAPNFKIL